MEQFSIFSKKLFSLKATKYFVSGIIAFLFDNLTLNFIKFVLKIDFLIFGILAFHKVISSIVGITISYILNKQWTFKDNDRKSFYQAFKFFAYYLVTILIATLLFTLYDHLLRWVGVNEAISATFGNFLAEGTKMFLSFFVYKHIVFK